MENPNPLIISAIVAMSENNVIGKNNQLHWHLPADLQHFKAITTPHTILMGRKTFISIGKPLPNRINIVMTKDHAFRAEGCILVHSIEEARKWAIDHHLKEIFNIGGSTIYQQWMPYLDRIYLTIVHDQFAGDTYFPALNTHEWQEITRETHPADAVNPYAYSFLELTKK